MIDHEILYGMYEKSGISKKVLDYADKICRSLEDRFHKIDQVSEYNQLKVLQALQKNRVSAEHMNGTTGTDT